MPRSKRHQAREDRLNRRKLDYSDLAISTGHQANDIGCGRHKDSRTKRARTRGAALRKAINDS